MEAFSVIVVLAFLAYLYSLDKKPKCQHANAAETKRRFKEFETSRRLEEENEQLGIRLPSSFYDDYDKPILVRCDKCGEKYWYN